LDGAVWAAEALQGLFEGEDALVQGSARGVRIRSLTRGVDWRRGGTLQWPVSCLARLARDRVQVIPWTLILALYETTSLNWMCIRQ
jgi:hypothetical protein